MTYQTLAEILRRHKEWDALDWLRERLEGVEGSEQRLVTQAAKRVEEQGGAESRRQENRRVTPVKVKSIRLTGEPVSDYLNRQAVGIRKLHSNAKWWDRRSRWIYAGAVAALEKAASLVDEIDEPESEARSGLGASNENPVS